MSIKSFRNPSNSSLNSFATFLDCFCESCLDCTNQNLCLVDAIHHYNAVFFFQLNVSNLEPVGHAVLRVLFFSQLQE